MVISIHQSSFEVLKLTAHSHYILDDPVVSNRHLRIYSIVYDSDKPTNVTPLVYAEDLSRNGTFWNSSLIGRGNGGFLLSDGDTLRVSSRIYFTFRTLAVEDTIVHFDLVQEAEIEVQSFISSAVLVSDTPQKFKRTYTITDRLLGSGAFG